MPAGADRTRAEAERALRAWLERQRGRGLLRFITCGHVDDGKSTLIGRLLHDSRLIPDDRLEALAADSRRHGTQSGGIDPALLLDGLSAEREQGITIDVAYLYFATGERSFIVADAPGHEQYTRNMATGASTAELALILVDARKGVLTQTRRHSAIVRLLGIRKAVLAVNKMDLVGYESDRFEAIAAEYRALAERIGLDAPVAIPVSALHGDNVAVRSAAMPWYEGPTVIEHLEGVPLDRDDAAAAPLRMPVQSVCRAPDFRGFAGLVASGTARPGDRVEIQPSGRTTTIARIVAPEGDREAAAAGDSAMLAFADEVDCSRGDAMAAAAEPLEVADQFEAHLVWMSDEELLPGRTYLLRIGTATAGAARRTVLPASMRIGNSRDASLSMAAVTCDAVGVAAFDSC